MVTCKNAFPGLLSEAGLNEDRNISKAATSGGLKKQSEVTFHCLVLKIRRTLWILLLSEDTRF